MLVFFCLVSLVTLTFSDSSLESESSTSSNGLFGTVMFEGVSVDLDKWCNTAILGDLTPQMRDNCFAIAKWSSVPGSKRGSLVTTDFTAIHYLPSDIPLGGTFCCGSNVFTQRGFIFFSGTYLQSGSWVVTDRTIMAVSDTKLHIRQVINGIVIDTGKSFASVTSILFYFNDEGLVYLVEIWSEPESITDAFKE